jgi:hypothetical protein
MVNLSGMFKQLNEAILGNPLAGDSGGQLLTMASQGLGEVGGELTGTDPMTWMTGEAKQEHAKDKLGTLDLQTAEGLGQAAKLYQQMGDVEKATQFATMAGEKTTQQAEALEKSREAFATEARKERGIATAMGRGDKEAADAIRSGLISPEEYYKTLFQSKVKVSEAVASRDPYANAFTRDITMPDGRIVPVRFAGSGEPIAVLGEGTRDTQIAQVYDPAAGADRAALVDKQNPQNITFLGEDYQEQPTYTQTKVGDRVVTFMTPAGGGMPVRVGIADNITQAEKDLSKAKSQVKTINLLHSVDSAISMIDEYGQEWDGVGGWSGLGKYVPGEKGKAFEALITSIKSNVGFESLRNLKEEGGTLGQVSNIENLLLQSEIATLDTLADAESIKLSLQKIRNIKERTFMAEFTDNPDALFTAETDENGQPTGSTLYRIDENSIAVTHPDGTIEIVKRNGES